MSPLSRSVRSVLSGLVLGIGAIALDAPATPDRFGQDPWMIRPGGDDALLGSGSRPDALGIDESRPVLELGEIPFDIGALTLTRGSLSEGDASLSSGSRFGPNSDPASPGSRPTRDNTEQMPWEITLKEISSQLSFLSGVPQWLSLGGPSDRPPPRIVDEPAAQPDDVKPHELRWIVDEVRRIATHPVLIFIVVLGLSGWLTAKVMNHVDRLRASSARAPVAAAPRRRGRNRR